ncbi:hypothetical protein FOC84_06525 [Achromobacter pestifer]|uniref:Uncharacterized protein n=1 Tax=Achromobacter pestifer TaxID=1353889 RepID=A0A7D4IJE0_9BURK|nr:hypothetical protein [Achromobacter pestifer]QKH34624.1 hypothetical protein FOC84_06525 [Achromobacter pestifer]
MTENNAAQPGLTDDEIRVEIHNTIGFAFDPGETQEVNAADLMNVARALLSKLRAPVADERAAFEYGAPADVAQRIEQYLAQDGRMNSATQLLYEAMKALRASQGDRNDG